MQDHSIRFPAGAHFQAHRQQSYLHVLRDRREEASSRSAVANPSTQCDTATPCPFQVPLVTPCKAPISTYVIWGSRSNTLAVSLGSQRKTPPFQLKCLDKVHFTLCVLGRANTGQAVPLVFILTQMVVMSLLHCVVSPPHSLYFNWLVGKELLPRK